MMISGLFAVIVLSVLTGMSHMIVILLVRVPHLKSADPAFESCLDQELDLFQEVLGSTPQLCLHIGN